MVEDPSAAPGVTSGPFDATKPGEFQVYPPVMPPQGDAAPALPGDLPPEGAIPTVIDPEAFVAPTTDQATAPTTNEATAPAANAESQGTPSPLPPNGEDE
jgi:hypothetical protein